MAVPFIGFWWVEQFPVFSLGVGMTSDGRSSQGLSQKWSLPLRDYQLHWPLINYSNSKIIIVTNV